MNISRQFNFLPLVSLIVISSSIGGCISMSELRENTWKELLRADTDGSNTVSFEELKTSEYAVGEDPAQVERDFKGMDANNDGEVTKKEVIASMKK